MRSRTVRSVFLALGVYALLAVPGGAGPGEPVGLPFDHFLRYDEMTALLRSWAAARPGLMTLESIGKSREGRDLWFVTLTNAATGPAAEKPALLVDGNMHALEWTGGVAALNFIRRVLHGYGVEDGVTRLADTRCVYVLPRVSPDGVEATLRDVRILRSAPPAPAAAPEAGLRMSDLDGDGRVVFMRFRDPRGPWKLHPGEPRLLVARSPDETGGDYWRVVPEGTILGYDGASIPVLPALEGIDFGVGFPDDRDPVPPGAAAHPDPAVLPEIAAYVRAIRSRPNIFAHVTCHSFGGGLLMPPVNAAEGMPQADRFIYQTLAGRAAELTGYDVMSYLDLRGGQGLKTHIPTEIGWFYNSLGVFSFITEFWNPLKAAGIELHGPMSLWLGGLHPVDDEIRLLRWNDRELAGRGFVPWHAFRHPQLGPVEIGGWDKVHYWYNAPFDRLEKEVAPHADWLTYLALSSPRLEVRAFTAEPDGPAGWRVRLVLENAGWLPTGGSARAVERKAVAGITVELDLPAGARVLEGELRRDAGQLAGRSEQRSTVTWWGYAPGTPDRAVFDWRIGAPAGTVLRVTARQARSGTVRAEIRLTTRPGRAS